MLVLGLARTVKRGVSVRSDSSCHLRMGLEHGRLLQMSWKWMTMMRVTSVVCSAQDGTSSGAAVMCRRWNRAAIQVRLMVKGLAGSCSGRRVQLMLRRKTEGGSCSGGHRRRRLVTTRRARLG